jgi:hypothetical protein
VVASPIAMRGIADPPPSVTVADDAESFAAAIRSVVAATPGPDGVPPGIAWARERQDRFAEEVRVAAEALAGTAAS